MDELLVLCIVPHVDDQRPSFPDAQQRAGHLAVVCQRLHRTPGAQFERHLADPQRHIGGFGGCRLATALRARSGMICEEATGRSDAGSGEDE